ncbi:MAG: hypothetical protein KGH69_02600 [Candidatus Micrarchaeota archaeon]|nr:hypothetical protein [Candidatus Micrarchaeota archaeon]
MRKARRPRARAAKPRGKMAKKVKRAVRLVNAYDVHELLVSDFAAHGTESRADVDVEDLVYSATESLASLGYKSGYAVGRSLFARSNRENMLPEIMEKLGFGKVLYSPSSYRMVITSFDKRSPDLGIGASLHIFESGIIAGYVSASSGMHVVTNETHCSSNRSRFCQFITFPDTSAAKRKAYPDTRSLPESICAVMDGRKGASRNARYHMLASAPLLEEPLLQEVAKLLYLAGELMAERHQQSTAKDAIAAIAGYFGIGAELVRARNRRVIKLKYGHYNSSDAFLKYSTAMLLGFASRMFGGEMALERGTTPSGNYTVTIESRAIK